MYESIKIIEKQDSLQNKNPAGNIPLLESWPSGYGEGLRILGSSETSGLS